MRVAQRIKRKSRISDDACTEYEYKGIRLFLSTHAKIPDGAVRCTDRWQDFLMSTFGDAMDEACGLHALNHGAMHEG